MRQLKSTVYNALQIVSHESLVCCVPEDTAQAVLYLYPAGNIIFLPRGAVVIDIVPENNEDKSPWVVYMCADFKPLFISPITIPPQKTVLQMAKVRRTKEWAMLTPYWRQRILREGICPEVCAPSPNLPSCRACRHRLAVRCGWHTMLS